MNNAEKGSLGLPFILPKNMTFFNIQRFLFAMADSWIFFIIN